jgi:hypothetical protein
VPEFAVSEKPCKKNREYDMNLKRPFDCSSKTNDCKRYQQVSKSSFGMKSQHRKNSFRYISLVFRYISLIEKSSVIKNSETVPIHSRFLVTSRSLPSQKSYT